jgi:hypothetical protein
MRKITLFLFLCVSYISFAQTLVTNGDFESNTGSPIDNWSGYNHQVLSDDLTSSNVGNGNNGDASIYQEFGVTAGHTYRVSFEYRWVSGGTAEYTMTVRAKDAGNLSNNVANSAALNTTPDVWHTETFTFTPTPGITDIRLLFYKGNTARPFRVDNVSVRRLYTWDGSSGTDWATDANWDTGSAPGSDVDIDIPDVANAPIIGASTGVDIYNLTNAETDGINITSGGTLRVSGTSSGNITYNRTIGNINWFSSHWTRY